MGQITKATQGRQLTRMDDPTGQMQRLLRKSWPRIAAVIGNNMSPQRLFQMYVSTINREPQLAACSVQSVLSCFMKCAALGLEPSNVDGLGRAYILPYGNKNMRGQKEATFILGYKGMIDLARRSGQIGSIAARAVHEGDEFEYSYGLEETLRHVPCANPGRLTHVYMVATFKDGSHYMHVMNAKEIEEAAKRSPSYGKAMSPWKSDYEAMAKKTVIRRAFPYLPVSVEAQSAAAADDRTPDYADVFAPVFEPGPSVEATAEPAGASAPGMDEPAPADTPEPAAPADPLEAKRARMRDLFAGIGVDTWIAARPAVAQVIGRDVDDPSKLSEAELDKIIADIKAGTRKAD